MSSFISNEECVVVLLNRSAVESSSVSNFLSILDTLEASINIAVHNFESYLLDCNQLSAIIGAVKIASASGKRMHALVAGAYLEDQITVVVLQALAEGFDVYLLNDFIVSRQSHFVQTFHTRLMQAGAVPTTLRQLLYQCATAESDRAKRSVLLDLIERYDRVPAS